MSDMSDWTNPREDIYSAVEQAFASRMSGRELSPTDVPGSGESPDPTNEATPAPTTQDSGPGPESVGSDVVAPSDPTPPTAEPPPPEASPVTFMGREFSTEDQAREFLDIYDWATSLDPSMARAITELSTGNYYLVPREDPYHAPAPIITQAPTPQAPPDEPDPLAQIDLDDVDPQILTILQAQQQQLREMQQQIEDSRTLAQSAVQSDWSMAAERAISSYRDSHPYLTDADMRALGDVMVRNNVLDALSAQYNEPEALYSAALDWATHAVPEIRERDIENRINARASEQARQLADLEAATSADIQAKVMANQAANTTSGSVPRTDPAPAGLNKQQRLNAMSAEIAASLSGP